METPFALFLDTIHRGSEAFLVALGVDLNGVKMALGFWQGSSENYEICEALFRDLERRRLVRSKRILFVTDGASGRARRYGNGSVRSWCLNGAPFIRPRNLKPHLATRYRHEARQRLKTAWEQTRYADAQQMRLELMAWWRT